MEVSIKEIERIEMVQKALATHSQDRPSIVVVNEVNPLNKSILNYDSVAIQNSNIIIEYKNFFNERHGHVISEIKKIQAKLDHFDKTVLEDLF
jgi:hypothetical protein